ncbi:hypothetical protein KZ829_22260 [Actinoplanes hulinensis]|uniref:Uncharacterized protein n=1 Tax=Actinoplanes hulinensis TaxID=1144547 RepID=A0ABS7B5Z6_9ACTN|nr:hypothetical protein [Actinoplanes hulinensis]MBW6436469.1 hypothetical protein [Actinoplanes hulinensis]
MADSDLYHELKRLRRGRGVERLGLGGFLGPEIRRRCRLGTHERENRVHAAVGTLLRELAADLAPDMRQAAMLAFALDRDSRFPTLLDREQRLADLQNVSVRTARRRIDDAVALMAQAGEKTPEPPADPANGSGWRVSSLRALFRLDTATPELYEMRTIVATREIDEIVIRIGLPESPAEVGPPGVDALFGARVRTMEPNGSGQRAVLELPDKMQPGDIHEFWLRVTLAPGQPIWPYYAIVPLDPCESGTVRVRFGARRPAEVWLLDEVPYTDLRNRPPGRTVIEPSPLGEVVRDFHNLREGHGYGLAWTPLSVS